MFNLSDCPRYLWRELLPRTAVMLFVTYLLLPYCPGLAFRGGFFAALFTAFFFTANFWLWGSQIMGALRVRKFIASIDSGFWTGVLYTATIILFPLTAIILPVLVAPQIFVCTGWYGILIWIVALNLACYVTHDWKVS
jgi:hypothetical protein